MNKQTNTFFTKDVYDTEIHLEVNEDIMDNIYSDGVKATDMLPIEFVFITNTKDKADQLKEQLSAQFPLYTQLAVEETEDYWEVHGVTNNTEMSLNAVNNWNQVLWDLGFEYDCQLDGWQVGT